MAAVAAEALRGPPEGGRTEVDASGLQPNDLMTCREGGVESVDDQEYENLVKCNRWLQLPLSMLPALNTWFTAALTAMIRRSMTTRFSSRTSARLQ